MQFYSKLGKVTDLVVQGRTTIVEARAIVQWIRRQQQGQQGQEAGSSSSSSSSSGNSSSGGGGVGGGGDRFGRNRGKIGKAGQSGQRGQTKGDAGEREAGEGEARERETRRRRSGRCVPFGTDPSRQPVVIAGVSMGGLHAAMVASLHQEPLGMVSQ